MKKTFSPLQVYIANCPGDWCLWVNLPVDLTADVLLVLFVRHLMKTCYTVIKVKKLQESRKLYSVTNWQHTGHSNFFFSFLFLEINCCKSLDHDNFPWQTIFIKPVTYPIFYCEPLVRRINTSYIMKLSLARGGT